MKGSEIPFFSVITPVLNSQRFVFRFCASLLAQEFHSWELIVVDDGCTDNTIQLLCSILGESFNYRILTRSEKKLFEGPYAARNLAIDHARGQYILFWDVDDAWAPHHMSVYADFISKNRGVHIVYSPYFLVHGDCSSMRPYAFRSVPPPYLLRLIVHFANPLPVLTTCVSSCLLSSCRFSPVGHEDYVLWHSLLNSKQELRIRRLVTTTSFYSVQPSSQSSNKLKGFFWIYSFHRSLGRSRVSSSAFMLLFLAYHLYVTCRVSISRLVLSFPLRGV